MARHLRIVSARLRDLTPDRHTADSLAKGDQLLEREIGAFDATDNRPLALEVDGPGNHVGQILYTGECDVSVIDIGRYNYSTIVEIKRDIQLVNVIG